MDPSRRAAGYDLFKLIVAILLLILALMLMWVSPPQAPALIATPFSSSPATALRASPAAVPTLPTSTPQTIPTDLGPSPTETNMPKPTPTPLSSPTIPPEVAPTATPVAESLVSACEAASSHSRLGSGTNATIVRRLNFRSSPGIRDNWLLTNIPDTSVTVVGGPECLPYSTGAYLWWQIRLPDGRIGWSAEGSAHGSFYFMEPDQ